MSDSPQKNGLASKGPGNEPARKSVVAVILVVCVLTVVGGVFYMQKNKAPSQGPGEVQGAGTSNQEQPQLVEHDPKTNVIPGTVTGAVKPSAVTPGIPRATTPAVAVDPNRPQPSPQTRQLVKSLTELDFKTTPMTAEKATEWKQNLQQLVQQGAAAVPALQEFFEKNQDLRFDGSGTNFFGEPTLRQALLKALPSIGGPEALALQTQVLQTTADPQEIALLAKQLDQQVPEQYRQMAMDAARAALQMAASGKLPGRDVGPLFGVLQQFGDANTVPELQRLMSNWRYYGAIALTDMPNGSGIPALVDMAQNPNNRSARNIALQMLAQVAPQSDFARQALLIEAKNGELSGATWIEIGSALSGNVYGIGVPGETGSLPVSGEKRWHLSQGEQNFYSRPAATLTAEEVNQRVALIDELMAGNSNQAALDSLQRAKATLQSRLAPPPAPVNPAPAPTP